MEERGREFSFPPFRARPSGGQGAVQTRRGPARTWGELLETPVLLPELRVGAAVVGRRLAAAQTPSVTMGGPTGGVQGGAKPREEGLMGGAWRVGVTTTKRGGGTGRRRRRKSRKQRVRKAWSGHRGSSVIY